MGLTKPQVKDYTPLICRIERRLSASSQLLSYARRLQLVNSVLSSLPTYYMCSLKLPVAVVDIIDKHRKNCLWRGSDFRKKGYNLAAWNLVMKPKDKGGLGIINLTLQNDALLLKQLDKFYNKADIQWVSLIWKKYYPDGVPHLRKEKGSFWWKDILRLHTQYRGVAICTPNKGDTVSLWDDLILDVIHSQKFPNLFEFAKDPAISLWQIGTVDSLISCFRIPMTRQAYNELLELQEELLCMQPIMSDAKDCWSFIWGHQNYSSSKYYHYQFASIVPPRAVIWIWKARCVPKIKFFAWLMLNDRLNTRNMLRRRNKFLEEGYCCVLCQNNVEETIEHLFFDCPSAISRWFVLGIVWEEGAGIQEKLIFARRIFPHPFFMEIFMIGAWCIWNERNALIFDGIGSWKAVFKKEVNEHLFKIKQRLHSSIRQWFEAL
jgi:hypothetical protein